MRMIWGILAEMLWGGCAHAQSVASPNIQAGDTWVYASTLEDRTGWHQTRIESRAVRAGATSIAVSSKAVGSTMPEREQLVGVDWSRMRSVNGHETVVNRPLAFPLSMGKSWEVEYTDDHPNRQRSSEHWKTMYRVTGWEDVTVPAGPFHAIKIEADGQWSAAIAPAVAAASGARVDGQGATTVTQTSRIAGSTISGRTYKVFCYVPGVKRWVKSVEEYYDPNGVRVERRAEELEFDKVAG